ncbi:enoyl-CoA hydratase [Ancylobacter dichloromethanicus]|uniref:3-hydroxyisobutyryl-CoA hydrolase n=2 Tax=Ancylobacter dichloromethanicus TaxID=518825 RepID=A0A9W6J889_9HYPH|nr:enoyl-CoA hydratase [Ancylobacter dichloromethanicus]
MDDMTADIGISFARRGAAGIVTLDRPRALNALDHAMVKAMDATMRAWIDDPRIAHVVLRSAHERAFCVGGDVRAMAELGRTGRKEEARQYWRDEYALDYLIARYPKPFASLVDGLCFGGGFGLSGHGRYRIAGEHLGFAMPEVAIGLFPDVGGTYVLPRLPGWSGTWLAMTGARIGMADAVALGLYTHHIPAVRWPELIDALAAGEAMQGAITRLAVRPPAPALAHLYPHIDRIFAGGSVAAIVIALQKVGEGEGEAAEFARVQLETIRRASPTSVHIAFQQMQRGLGLDLAGCLGLEFRLVTRLLDQPDFFEGVRALLVDKDQRPVWQPARLEDVDPAALAALFDEPLADELLLA